MPSMNISLTSELAKIVHNKVESGLYNNASEVIRDAIRQLDANNELREIKSLYLREKLSKGLKQAEKGEFADYSIEDIIENLDNESK